MIAAETFFEDPFLVPYVRCMAAERYLSSMRNDLPLMGTISEPSTWALSRSLGTSVFEPDMEQEYTCIGKQTNNNSSSTLFPRREEIETLLKSVASLGVKIADIDQIQVYLQNSDVEDILLDVCRIAIEKINHGSHFYLEFFQNHEENDDQHLNLVVRQDLYEENILEKIADVWAQYDQLLIGKSGYLLVTTDFSPPC